jgi:hypothetical protein
MQFAKPLLAAVTLAPVAIGSDLVIFFERGGAYGTPRELHSLETETGTTAPLSVVDKHVRLTSLTTEPSTGAVHAVNWISGVIFTVDLSTGVSTRATAIGFGPGLTGIAEPGPSCRASVYCSAKLNSLGCLPSLAARGASSVSSVSGFVISASHGRNREPGLLVYTVDGGRGAHLFQAGVLCVGPLALRRAPAQSSGGSAPPAVDCSGLYRIDMNAFAAGALGGNPAPQLSVAGTLVHAQWWGRDRGFAAPNDSTLSAGLEYTTCP